VGPRWEDPQVALGYARVFGAPAGGVAHHLGEGWDAEGGWGEAHPGSSLGWGCEGCGAHLSDG